MSGIGAFGPFALVVESGDGPALLDPQDETAASTVSWLKRIMERSEYRSLHFRELLGVEDPGANLVGVAAVALHPRRHKFIPDLWKAIDRGTDAAPQIAYLLRWTDPDFAAAGKERIEGLCEAPPVPEGATEPDSDSPPDSATLTRTAGCVSALLSMMATVDGETEWTERRQADPEVRSLLASLDKAQFAITQWGERFESLLESS